MSHVSTDSESVIKRKCIKAVLLYKSSSVIVLSQQGPLKRRQISTRVQRLTNPEGSHFHISRCENLRSLKFIDSNCMELTKSLCSYRQKNSCDSKISTDILTLFLRRCRLGSCCSLALHKHNHMLTVPRSRTS